MTKHKAGESEDEKEYREILEHNKKVMAESHIDIKGHSKRLGEHYRQIVATFSDKEIEEATLIGIAIANKTEPEDGVSYEEIATVLWGDTKKDEFEESLPEEYLKDDAYRSKVDRLLHVLRNLAFELMFDTTIEPHEKGKRGLSILPCVRSTKKIRDSDGKITNYDESIEMIFNGVKREYASEELLKFGHIRKVELPDREEMEAEFTLRNLKGDYTNEQNLGELIHVAEAMEDTMHELSKHPTAADAYPNGIEETEMMHKVLPESTGKTGKGLEPYTTIFYDALYMVFRKQESRVRKSVKKSNERWKRDHGYLEGK